MTRWGFPPFSTFSQARTPSPVCPPLPWARHTRRTRGHCRIWHLHIFVWGAGCQLDLGFHQPRTSFPTLAFLLRGIRRFQAFRRFLYPRTSVSVRYSRMRCLAVVLVFMSTHTFGLPVATCLSSTARCVGIVVSTVIGSAFLHNGWRNLVLCVHSVVSSTSVRY